MPPNPNPAAPIVVADFFDEAGAMRAAFEARVGAVRTIEPERFVWDYWHVPGQYSYLRTIPPRFFDAGLYRRFLGELRAWGAEHLGCRQVTEPWLSYYVDGCRQELHTDVVQGPFAYVYSLTRWDSRRFAGGETVLLRPALLDYWRHLDPTKGRERDELIDRVPASFNQLLVFDARVPHGVVPVEGTLDPLDSRVVMHGWFLPPRLAVEGALQLAQVEAPVTESHARWHQGLPPAGGLTGLTVLRLSVEASGAVTSTAVVSATLVSTTGARDAAARGIAAAQREVASLQLPTARGPSTLTVPFTAETR